MDRDERWLSTALRVAPLALFLWIVKAELIPVALGALFALLLVPLQRRIAGRSPFFAHNAPLLLTAGSIVLVVIPFVMIAASVVASTQSFLSGGLVDMAGRLQAFASEHFAGLADRLHLPVASLRNGATNLAQRVGSAIASFASGVASALPGQIVDLFLFVLALYYFLRDGPRLVRWLMRLSPFPPEETHDLFASIHDTVRGAILGQLATSAVQGGLTLVSLYAFGVPGALMFGIIAMLLSVVPLVGTTPVTLGAAIYLLASGRVGAAVGMAAAAALIGVSDNVVRPWVQSARSRMHPLVTLLAIFGGIAFMGAAGVFLGPVIAAMAIWTIDLYADHHRKPPPSADPVVSRDPATSARSASDDARPPGAGEDPG